MAFQDERPFGGDVPRSLSEQLRILEKQLNRLSGDGSSRIAHPTQQPHGPPMSLGRQIGLAAPARSPELGVPERYDDEDETSGPAGRTALRRRIAICAFSLLLLSSTAVIPSLWQAATPDATDEPAPAEVSLRTEQFAHTARELGQGRFAAPTAADTPTPASAPPAAAPAMPVERGDEQARAPARPMATLTVAESELPRLSLPMLVSGGGRAWAGSAVIIDGLPTDARVSHGMKIAPDTWTVGIADVGQAVISLPRTTPDNLELSVRVVAADSHELAASALRIQVLRGPERPAQIAPAAIFQPAAAETEAGREIDPGPADRQAVKVDRRRPANPASPHKPPPTQTAKQRDWPTATSAWVTEQRPAPPSIGLAPMPKWAPFGER